MATFPSSPRPRAANPATPVHSPHHSVHSSASSRLSSRNLTLHEYRKLQNSPAPQATPPGKTLRRKAAASGLNEVERVPSVSRTPLAASRELPRPLHISHSTHQLFSYHQLPPSPPPQQHEIPSEVLRAQSAGPFVRDYRAEKVREFKPIKRLPKPLPSPRHAVTAHTLPQFASVKSNEPRKSPLQTASFPSWDISLLADSQTTPSTPSLSRFPRPPNLNASRNLPQYEQKVSLRVNTTSFASTAPATPPATPAVIHYRGASFDLVNPHDSLVLENIVTPSRENGSFDYLPLRSSEDPLISEEMPPKAPLYGDLTSAYSSITRREAAASTPELNFPLPPTPAAMSPGSSQFSSGFQSPESESVGSPVTANKPVNDSRFSLKQLTKSFANKLSSKNPEVLQDEELQDLSGSRASLASADFEGEFPRPLERSYRVLTPKTSGFFDRPRTPDSPLDRAINIMSERASGVSAEQPRNSPQRIFSAPLTSMIPDDNTSQRASLLRPSATATDLAAKPYYDDLASIYPSSSVYTSEDQRLSRHAISQLSNRRSDSPWPGGAEALAEDYQANSVPFPNSQRTSRPVSQTLGAMMHHQRLGGDEKADTISKFIDHYQGPESSNDSQPLLNDKGKGVDRGLALDRHASTSSHTDLDLDTTDSSFDGRSGVPHFAELNIGKSALTRHPGSPPAMPAPLAPAYNYSSFDSNGRRYASDMFSKDSSYEDTRDLLQFSSQPAIRADQIRMALQPSSSEAGPSSSHSQIEAPSAVYTPKEALDEAEAIFNNTASQQHDNIPAMWSKRVSSHLLRNNSQNAVAESQEQEDEEKDALAGYEDEDDFDDWETVGDASQGVGFRDSVGLSIGQSIADYSSSEGSHSSRDSNGFSKNFPVGSSPPPYPPSMYRHPLPMGTHANPFFSSPPRISVGNSLPTMVHHGRGRASSSTTPVSVTVPAFGAGSPDTYTVTPWATRYDFSDKETQELLASGPNDAIIYEGEGDAEGSVSNHSNNDISSSPLQLDKIPIPSQDSPKPTSDKDLGHRNSFEKVTVIGPEANLTGTPGGTGMQRAGSSIANNSSPGAAIDFGASSSSPSDRQYFRTAAAPGASRQTGIGSFVEARRNLNTSPSGPAMLRIPVRTVSGTFTAQVCTPSASSSRTPSQAQLCTSPGFIPSSSLSATGPRSPFGSRRTSRAAVTGQTKLRQMMLADAQSLASARSLNHSRIISADSIRPSTSDTHTPLRRHITNPFSSRVTLTSEHSPHLLCPERALSSEEERRRHKLSWVIFAIFCVLPPMLILYRWMGDSVIVNVTSGHITHVSPRPKQIALRMGIAVNICIVVGILLPILIAYAEGVL